MNVKSVCVIGALILAAGFPRAHAANLDPQCSSASGLAGSISVLYSESCSVQGSAAPVTTLKTPGAGELFLTLTDLGFPTPFASLYFSLSDSSTALIGLADPGTLRLSVSGPTTLYADVFATTQTGSGVGLYNLTATFLDSASPVPLPASGILLATALLMLLTLGYSPRLLRSLWPGRPCPSAV